MEAELRQLLGQSFVHEPYTGHDGYGNNVYATATTVACRIDSRVRDRGQGEQDGQLVASPITTFSIIVDVGRTYTEKDRVTLSGSGPAFITEVEAVYDETTTVHHYVLTVIEGAVQ